MTAAVMPKPVYPPPTSHKPMGRGRWNPWKALIEDHPDYRVITKHELPPNILGLTSFSECRIWLCSTLNPVQADCTLAHELVHIERGSMPVDYDAAIAEERLVCEITARRLIPFRDLAHFMVWWPNASTANLSSLLHVDAQTVHQRLLTLTPNERAALAALRGGPLHTVPEQGLWDDPDHPHPIPGLRGATRRRCGTCDTAEKP